MRLESGKTYEAKSGVKVLITASDLKTELYGSAACGWFVDTLETGLWKANGHLIKCTMENTQTNDLVNELYDDLLALVSKNNRVCPAPRHWDAIYQMLPEQSQHETGLPLILGAWGESSPMDKIKRLRTHLHAAAQNNLVDDFRDYLNLLQNEDEDWHHIALDI